MLTKSKIMSLPAVRKYLHMLNLQSEDFNQVLTNQHLVAKLIMDLNTVYFRSYFFRV